MSDASRETSREASTSPKRPEANPAYETQPVANRLETWFRENGGWLSSDVKIVYSGSRGFHIRALRALTSPIVVTCPLPLTLSYLSLDPTQSAVPHVDSPLRKCLGRIPNHVLTYLLLIEQRYLVGKEQSPWKEYLACLPEPEAMTTPLWFDEDDMRRLSGTSMARATKDKREELRKEWEQATDVMRQADATMADKFDFKCFVWAATIISSRSFISTHILPSQDTFPILFPVIDILNHTVEAKVEWDFHPLQDFILKVVDPEAVRPGDEIFNNYGPKQNDELLLGYGFCIPENPVDQFTIKVVLPPSVEDAAKQMGLFEPNNIPFGMGPSFLDGDPKQEQHALRPKGHPFGRYENYVLWLRGIPPYVVHVFYVRALMNLNMHPKDVDMQRPAARVVLEVLLLLYEAIDQRSQTLPLADAPPQTFPNDKQKYATIYRDGQANIIHSIRTELATVLNRLRVSSQIPPPEPVIITTTEALITLSADLPAHFSHFKAGLSTYYGVEIADWASYGAQIAAFEEDNARPAELSIWSLLLFLFAYLCITRDEKSDDSIVYAWTRELFAMHGLPSLDACEEAASLSKEVVANFVGTGTANGKPPPLQRLNALGCAPGLLPASALALAFSKDGPVEGLGDRLALWAVEVVEKYAFSLPEQDIKGSAGMYRMYMYMRPWKEDRVDEEWAYGNTEVLD